MREARAPIGATGQIAAHGLVRRPLPAFARETILARASSAIADKRATQPTAWSNPGALGPTPSGMRRAG
jgi:hypothetical protein